MVLTACYAKNPKFLTQKFLTDFRRSFAENHIQKTSMLTLLFLFFFEFLAFLNFFLPDKSDRRERITCVFD